MLICLIFISHLYNNLLLGRHNHILEHFFIMIHVFVVNKTIPMLIGRIIENNTMQNGEELHLCIFSVKVVSAIFNSSTFSVHSSINLSTNCFLHLQFFQSKHSPTSHNLSHFHSQLRGFQIDPSSHTPLSIYSLHSIQHLSSLQRCLLLPALASNLHLHLHI